MTDISDLIAAATRAQKTGLTDIESLQMAAAKRISKATQDAVLLEAEPNGPLSVELILRTLALTLGLCAKVNMLPTDDLQKMTLLAELAQLFIDVAMDQ